METKKDLILRDLYYSPKTGFRSAQHLFDLAVKEDEDITLKDVRDWLRTQETFTKYKTFNNPMFFRHTFVRYLGEQVQADLIVLGKFSSLGFPYILVVIEILSRFAFAYPLKFKSAEATISGFKLFLKDFKKRFDEKPKLIQFDEGTEFINAASKEFFEEEDISYFVSYSKRKATIVERLNRTLKEKMVKFIDSGAKNWIEHLPDLVENYNTQPHSSIGMEPAKVNKHNQYLVWGRLFGHTLPHVQEPKFKVGDRVRVLHFNPKGKVLQQYFKEKYPPEINPQTGRAKKNILIKKKLEAPFSQEIFRIIKVLLGDPIVYKLYSDEADVEILGKFYEAELSLVK